MSSTPYLTTEDPDTDEQPESDQLETDDELDTDTTDEVDSDEEEVDEDSSDEPASFGAPTAAHKAAHRAGVDRAKARRIATKALEVNDGDADARSVLALLLGVEDSPVALTVAIQTGDRTNLSYLDVLEQAMDEDAIGIGVMVSTMDRDVLRQVWTLARLLGADLAEKVPAAGRSTAMSLARTLADMPAGVPSRVAAIRELAKRG